MLRKTRIEVGKRDNAQVPMDDGFIQQFHESLLSYCPIKGIPYAGTDAKAPCQGDPTTGVWTSGPARGL